MLVVGKVGWGPSIHDTRLKPNEQITHISLWALQAAPLLIGADMSQFDEFTTNLMTNEEVLAVDQDALVKAARRVSANERLEVWARPLADGRVAVGLFNRGLHAAKMSVSWKDLGLTGPRVVRDLWAQKNIGTVSTEFSATVPAHGTVLVAIAGQRGVK
jgi:alpha-galactosidase